MHSDVSRFHLSGVTCIAALMLATAQPDYAAFIKDLPGVIRTEAGQVRYSAGFAARAAQVASLIDAATKFLGPRLKVRVAADAAVLTRADYARVGSSHPYGLPWVSDRPHVAFLPATDDGVVAKDLYAIFDRSPLVQRRARKLGLSRELAVRRIVDLIAVHEIGHVYVEAYGIKPPQHWVSELLANYISYAYCRQDRHCAPLWNLFDDEANPAPLPQFTTLADFERLYPNMEPSNYGWYQGQFERLAARVYEREGLRFLAAARSVFPAGDTRRWTESLLLEEMERLSPGFTRWAARLNGAD